MAKATGSGATPDRKKEREQKFGLRAPETGFSAAQIAARIKTLGREISKQYDGNRLDMIVMLDRGFVFAADLARALADLPMVCHFVRERVSDIEQSGYQRREVFFSSSPDVTGRDVLLVDVILDSGITQEFLMRRLGESQPKSLKLAVLLDKAHKRRVSMEADYFGFRTASNDLWMGYGLAAPDGTGRNHRQLSVKKNKAESARSATPRRKFDF
ncbi:MAG: hypothetical protein NVS9B4_14020 [Candidatus Acidiferrum sp.]